MIKYIKYYFPFFLFCSFFFISLLGTHYPTIYFLCFSILIISGDIILPRDKKIEKFSYTFLLDLSIYLALPMIFIFIFYVISIFSSVLPEWYLNFFNFFNINFYELKNSFTLVDKISIIVQTTLIAGGIGITGGHELVHRKKNKFDMFVGNWLLAFSCDCNFAIEHVYGHHKNVCLPEDPATAKRGQNIYSFILKAIFDENKSGWELESKRLSRKNYNVFSSNNRFIRGYLRSLFISLIAFLFSGFLGLFLFFLIAFLSKSVLEAINYIEHYGLVREKNRPVRLRHSWNSNHFFSSIYLYNVTRHSNHHSNSNLKFWELKPVDKDAPILPYGYLTMLYLVLIFPFLYKKIMSKELLNWDQNFANEFEKNLVKSL
ncbi:MAG: hypothetical protein CMG39_00570 [Candidatus Marinimicrobia bacterium]|nr:hypothetical protein [Candidatus Neomarinimicrobiota bacterium]|tara:strand:+ start:2302 stop:3423 length:1122 start_codon:yes stop_codon:yes gene_type:complete